MADALFAASTAIGSRENLHNEHGVAARRPRVVGTGDVSLGAKPEIVLIIR
jgi:hypothetical protein